MNRPVDINAFDQSASNSVRKPVAERVGVFLPTYKRPDLLRFCVLQWIAQTRQPDVISVHQNGGGGSYEWVLDDLRDLADIDFVYEEKELAPNEWYRRPLVRLLDRGCTHFFWSDHDDIYRRNHVEVKLAELRNADLVSNDECDLLVVADNDFRHHAKAKFDKHAVDGMSSSMAFNREFAVALAAEFAAKPLADYADQVVAGLSGEIFRKTTSASGTTTYKAHQGSISSASWPGVAFGRKETTKEARAMHHSAFKNMERCVETYLTPYLDRLDRRATVIDCGAQDVNGSFRKLFDHPAFDYTGLDMEAGPNVDIVSPDPYDYPLPDGAADVVLSGQMLEHSEFFWKAFEEMVRITKPGGYIFVIAPGGGPEHRYPVDCYRFMPDSMKALAKYNGITLIKSWQDNSSIWKDVVGVFVKRSANDTAVPSKPKRHLPGMDYRMYLRNAVNAMDSSCHLEIGTRDGGSLAGITAPSIAVDPEFKLAYDIFAGKPEVHLYQQTSTEFFKRHKVTDIVGRPIDSAFLDGLHHFEVLLMDFIETERQASPNGVIYLHDCLPLTVEMTERDEAKVARSGPFRGWWTGDVWKVPQILSAYRPDLTIEYLDCQPTGLVRITGLNPQNGSLAEEYDEIVEEWMGRVLTDDCIAQVHESCDLQVTRP